jgi:hypothetical protein
MIISNSIPLKIRIISDKVVQKINTHFMFNNFFFSFENRAVYEIMWKSVVDSDRP